MSSYTYLRFAVYVGILFLMLNILAKVLKNGIRIEIQLGIDFE